MAQSYEVAPVSSQMAPNIQTTSSTGDEKWQSSSGRSSILEKTTHEPEKGAPVTPVVCDQDQGQTHREGPPQNREEEIVDWDGAEDPRRPVNWPLRKKALNLSTISLFTLLTPLASSMVAPAVPLVMDEFGIDHSSTIGAFVVSIYVLGYAVGPLGIAPLSEVYGRQYVYYVSNIMFVVWNIACAVAPNIGSLLFFRLCAGLAGSCPLTIGGGSIADVFIQERRGLAMSIYSVGPLLGPVLGPVVGGYLGEAKGWRWVFWILAIGSAASTLFSIVVQDETYETVLLQRITEAKRKATGQPHLRSKLAPKITKKQYFHRAIVRPLKMLIFSPIVGLLSLYIAVVYGYLYLLFTTLTIVFESKYGFNSGNVGLTFLGLGVGSVIGMVFFGALSDRLLKHLAKKHGEMKPEFRLPPLMLGSLCIPIGLFWYGWSAEAGVHWIVPIIGTTFVGFGMLACMMPITVYLVDHFTIHAASAIAANTVARSLLGAFLPLAGPGMYKALGLGWGNSLLGFLALAMSPISWIFYRYGETIRKKDQVQF